VNLKSAALLITLVCLTTRADVITGSAIRIHDGDTFTLQTSDGEKHAIRLNGIDAPELDQPFGKASRDALRKRLESKQILVIFDKRDWRGRIIGTVLSEAENINLSMIAMGLAWYFEEFAADVPPIERLQYAAAQAKAKSSRLNLWAEAAMPPWKWRHQKRKTKLRPKNGSFITSANKAYVRQYLNAANSAAFRHTQSRLSRQFAKQ
jgi:endonuclease YncB( thermonuclease family)